MKTQLLCKDHKVCEIDQETGDVFIFNQALMLLNLMLSDFHETIKERDSNINSFAPWCADRVLSIDRRYAKRILAVNHVNIKMKQPVKKGYFLSDEHFKVFKRRRVTPANTRDVCP